jgi:hypothetical protein
MTRRVMGKDAQTVAGVAAAALLVLSSLALIAQAGDDEPVAEVLGQSVERTTTTTAEVEETTTTSAPVLSPVPIEETTTSIVADATSTTAQTTTTAGAPTGRTVERADTSSSFDYRSDGGGGMATSDNAPPRDPFKFSALGSDVDHDGVAELRSTMANQTNREIVFPDGLVLRFVIKRDGQQWRTVELRFPDTRSLPAGGSLEIESATPLQQQYGHYEVTGEVTIEYR